MKRLGIFLVALPFLVLFAGVIAVDGLRGAAITFGTSFAIVACIGCGLYLIENNR